MAKSMKDVFKGDKDGTPVNGPSTSGENQGAGAVTRLRETPGGSRETLSDNMGKGPYGIQENVSRMNQDEKGSAAFYDESSNKGSGDEHDESQGDKDVNDYYAELSKRRPPNYDRNSNLQVKQAPHDLSPADGGDGFIGSNTGPAVNFSYLAGKKGFTENKSVWDIESSFPNAYPENSGSEDAAILPGPQDSTDEFASWKYTKGDEGMPQTYFTEKTNDGIPKENQEPFGDVEGHPDIQGYPGDVSSGNRDFAELPVTEFTHDHNGGAPDFKFAGVKEGEEVYKVKTGREGSEMASPNASQEGKS